MPADDSDGQRFVGYRRRYFVMMTVAAFLHWRAAVRPLELTERMIRELH